ncbi:MAG: hypothetical protein KIT34_07180 [Cyanobacteria bacterium TGS_CYA1]|nr:hypothetical protein [Cyanobacteria bacterium TGS_CYA1]
MSILLHQTLLPPKRYFQIGFEVFYKKAFIEFLNAKTDYRDIIVAAEYAAASKEEAA